MLGCSIRALWILNQEAVVFSRRFLVVEKRWQGAWNRYNENSSEESHGCSVLSLLPKDREIASAFIERSKREESVHGFGIRVSQSTKGSDSWIDDPITRHIISLHIDKKDGGGKRLLWPLVLHIKGPYIILILPLVEPHHLKGYARICTRSDCGNSIGTDESISSLLIDLPCITGAFMVAHTLGDVIIGDLVEPEVIVSPTMGGLLDSLTGSIGISSISTRSKPNTTPTVTTIQSGMVLVGAAVSDAPRSHLFDKDALCSFISSSMPFGTPLDLNHANFLAIKANGFSSSEAPPSDLKQPAWKPYLYRGKQRILFTIHETINASMYDRDEIPDDISILGQVNCRADLEGLPDVLLPLTGLNATHMEVLSVHACSQISEQGTDKQSLLFSPPLGNFVLMRYQALCGIGPPVKGFYQLSMVSEDEGAFLFKLHIMEGYKRSPLTMEFCTVTMPFPRRRIVFFDGNPSVGTVSTTEHSVEWKLITNARVGKSIEATFPGTIRFSPMSNHRSSLSRTTSGVTVEEDSDNEPENSNNVVNIEEYLMEKMNKDLSPVDLEEPFCWKAYNYAKVSFKIIGGSLSGMSIDPKVVSCYPAVKAPVEFSMQASSGEYILWNTLGKCPFAASPKVQAHQ